APPVCSPDQPLHIHCGAGQSGLDAVQERPGGADQGGAEVAEKGHKGASGILPEEELSAAPTSDVGAAPWGCGLKGGGLWSSVLSVRMPVKAVPRANLALPVEPVTKESDMGGWSFFQRLVRHKFPQNAAPGVFGMNRWPHSTQFLGPGRNWRGRLRVHAWTRQSSEQNRFVARFGVKAV